MRRITLAAVCALALTLPAIAETPNTALPVGASPDGTETVRVEQQGAPVKLLVSQMGAGKIVGPASSTDTDLVSFSGTTGLLAQDSGIASTNVATLSGPQTFSGVKSFPATGIKVAGAGAGVVTLAYANSALNPTFTFPALTGTALVSGTTGNQTLGASSNGTVSPFSVTNTNAGSSAAVVLGFANNTSSTEATFTLNGGANSSGNGANSLTLAAAGGFFLPSVTNMPALTASLPIFTDASKNFTNTAPAGYSAVLSGTTASIGGGALIPGACVAGTATVTGATTSMASVASPAADPDSTLSTGIAIYSFVSSSNTVTVRICAIVAVTPTAVAYNVRVLQ